MPIYELAVAALREGAYDFIEKPYDGERLTTAVARAAEKRRLVLDNRRLRAAGRGAGRPAAARREPRDTQTAGDPGRVADTDVDVLVVGETGSGKEVVAGRAPVEPAAGEALVALNCARFRRPSSRASSSATRAEPSRAPTAALGRIEHASGGTLFLDEIESCPPAMQAKLLRVLETRGWSRLARTAGQLDLRVVAAGKIDLSDRGARRIPRGPLLPARRRDAARSRRCANDATTYRCSTSTSCGASADRFHRAPPEITAAVSDYLAAT